MCGQFALFAGLKSVVDYYNFLKNADFDIDGSLFISDRDDLYSFYQRDEGVFLNKIIKPMDYVPVITVVNNQLRFFPAKWGLIPFWVKDKKKQEANQMLFSYGENSYTEKPQLSDFLDISFAYKTINARIESIKEKPSFKYAYKQRRCLIPFRSFYEKSDNKTKYLFTNKENSFKSFAGLYEVWKNDVISLMTFTIVTTEANKYVADVHHRMPVILNEEKAVKWLEYYNDLAYFSKCNEGLLKEIV